MVRRPDAAPNYSLMTIKYRQRTSDAKRRLDEPSLSILKSRSLNNRIEPSSKIYLAILINAMSQASVSSGARQRLLLSRTLWFLPKYSLYSPSRIQCIDLMGLLRKLSQSAGGSVSIFKLGQCWQKDRHSCNRIVSNDLSPYLFSRPGSSFTRLSSTSPKSHEAEYLPGTVELAIGPS